MHIAAQLTAFFGRQTLAATACIAVGRQLLKTSFGGHHALRSVIGSIAARTQALRTLGRSACPQQPQSARPRWPSDKAV